MARSAAEWLFEVSAVFDRGSYAMLVSVRLHLSPHVLRQASKETHVFALELACGQALLGELELPAWLAWGWLGGTRRPRTCRCFCGIHRRLSRNVRRWGAAESGGEHGADPVRSFGKDGLLHARNEV